jgi:hypothetical protein
VSLQLERIAAKDDLRHISAEFYFLEALASEETNIPPHNDEGTVFKLDLLFF